MFACPGWVLAFGGQAGGGMLFCIREGGVGMEFSGAMRAFIGPCCLSNKLLLAALLKRASVLKAYIRIIRSKILISRG